MSGQEYLGDVENKFDSQRGTLSPVIVDPIVGNPGPLGLSSVGVTVFILSLHNVGAALSPVGPNNVVVGVAFFSGVCQLLAGMWEFRTGNTFGATTFSSYGGFWLSYAAIFMPGFGILESYGSDKAALDKSLGIYLLSWTILTGLFLIASHRSSIGLISLFFFLFLTFVLLTASKFNNSEPALIAAGVFGIITALNSWYCALCGLLTKDSSHFQIPIGHLN